ncbi:hypothetical protein WR25_17613 [Diploscapter pachys]|uniref:Uncharacterized protein n=1 Tax=Diploscapter pachys TaxID=2018661 RepID=A0A2A2K2Y6_9BILA|nr:hypothetical protein WR25_17613 [Diploscapter pachys]
MVAGRIGLERHVGGRRDGGVGDLTQPVHQRLEAVMLQEGAQRCIWNATCGQFQFFERMDERHVAGQFDQLAAEACGLGMLDQVLLELALLERVGRRGGEHALDIAMFQDQLGGGLRADAGDAGHVVDAVAHQCEHVAELFRPNAELLHHRIGAEAAVVRSSPASPAPARPWCSSRSGRPPPSLPPRCRAARRRGWRRGSSGIAGPDLPAAADGAPCTDRTSRCGRSATICRG